MKFINIFLLLLLFFICCNSLCGWMVNDDNDYKSVLLLQLSPKNKTIKHLMPEKTKLACKIIAMVVRFITRRFIGEYEKKMEKIYSFNTIMDNEAVLFEILDAKSGQLNVSKMPC